MMEIKMFKTKIKREIKFQKLNSVNSIIFIVVSRFTFNN